MDTENEAMKEREESLKSKNYINRYCCVLTCKTTKENYSELRFHSFPIEGKDFVYHKNYFGVTEKVDKLQAWKKLLNISGKINRNMKVCSKHFKKDYDSNGKLLIYEKQVTALSLYLFKFSYIYFKYTC